MNGLLLKGAISFTASFLGKQAVSKMQKSEYEIIDKKFSKIVNDVCERIQKDFPNVLGGSIDQFFSNEIILNELIIILNRKTEININKIYSFLDKETLPKEFVEEFIIRLKDELLKDRLFDRLFSENDVYQSIKSIESILKGNTDSFNFEKFVQTYKKTAVNNISQINFFGLSLSPAVKKSRKLLQDIYVIPNFKLFKVKESKKVIEHEFEENFKDNSIIELDDLIDQIYNEKTHSVIIGRPGAGKSILIKYLMYILLSGNINHPLSEYLPIRVELRKYIQSKKNGNMNLEKYIHYILTSEYSINNLSIEDVNDFLSKQKILMLFDGLDEIFHVNDKIEIQNDIENFLTLNQKSKGVVTSRNNGYDDAKMNEELFAEFEIMDFNENKIKEYVIKWYAENEKDKTVLEKEVKSFLELKEELDLILVSNPLSLSLIVILYRNMGRLPNSKLEIYRGCTDTLVEGWDENKELKFDLKVNNKKAIFTNLAFWQYSKLSEKQENNKITYINILNQVQNIILKLNNITEDQFEAEKFGKEFLDYAKKRSIYFDNNFTHKTFHEYYTALWIYQNCDAKGKLEERNTIISKYIENSYWYIVLELLISMIDEQQGDDEIINNLIKEQMKKVDNINVHYFLLTLIGNITNVGRNILIELIKQSILLTIKKLDMESTNSPEDLIKDKSTDKIFKEIAKLYRITKYNEIVKEALLEIDELLKENDEEYLKYIIFCRELDINLDLDDYSALLKEYGRKYQYVYRLIYHGKENYLEDTLRYIDYFGVQNLLASVPFYYKSRSSYMGYIFNFMRHALESGSLDDFKNNLLLLQSKGLKMKDLEKSVLSLFIRFHEDSDLVESIVTFIEDLSRKEELEIQDVTVD